MPGSDQECLAGGTPTDIFDFNGANGQSPYGNLILSGNTLYGTTEEGGPDSAGTVFSLQIVPEPSTWTAMASGMAVLGLKRHRRARRA